MDVKLRNTKKSDAGFEIYEDFESIEDYVVDEEKKLKWSQWKCSICDKFFSKNEHLRRHVASIHEGNKITKSKIRIHLVPFISNTYKQRQVKKFLSTKQ